MRHSQPAILNFFPRRLTSKKRIKMKKFTKTVFFNSEDTLPISYQEERNNFSNALILKELKDEFIEGYPTSFRYLLSYQYQNGVDHRVKFLLDIDSKWEIEIESQFILKNKDQRIIFDKNQSLSDGMTTQETYFLQDGIYEITGHLKYCVIISEAEEFAMKLRKVSKQKQQEF